MVIPKGTAKNEQKNKKQSQRAQQTFNFLGEICEKC